MITLPQAEVWRDPSLMLQKCNSQCSQNSLDWG